MGDKYNRDIYCAEIITFNRIAGRSGIRDVARALEIEYSVADKIAKDIDVDKDNHISDTPTNRAFAEKYPDLFKYAKMLEGVIVSIGVHPAATVVSPVCLQSFVGTYSHKDSPLPMVQIDMDEVEDLGLVKLDILRLNNLSIISKACDLAGIDMLTPDNMPIYDEKVYRIFDKNPIGVFQCDTQTAAPYFKKLFSKETIQKIREQGLDLDLFDIWSIGIAAIRPVGDSYREEVASGNVEIHGNELIDNFLSETFGYMVYQETLLHFFNHFCGYSIGEADIIRRSFTGGRDTSRFLPDIQKGFIKTTTEEYGLSEQEAKDLISHFTQTIIDSSGYLFNKSHSMSYTYNGFACAYLRTYYPLEFLTAALSVVSDTEIPRYYRYIDEETDIEIKPIQFRYSRSQFSCDKETNTIYQSIESVKHLNARVAEELYELRDNEYESFVDLLIDITENTSCNTRQLKILISLDFFKEFGDINKLLQIQEVFNDSKIQYKKTYVDKTKITRREALIEHEETLVCPKTTLGEKVSYQLEYMGYTNIKDDSVKPNVAIIIRMNANRYGNRFATLYRPFDGSREEVKIKKRHYEMNEDIVEGDTIITHTCEWEYKVYKDSDGNWQQSDEQELILSRYNKVK